MRWEDERYVRVYTRDNPDWLGLSFDAQALMCLLLRKVDRAGLLALGKHGRRSVALAIGHVHAWKQIEPALDELLADGCMKIEGDTLVIPNFIEAQEAKQSDKKRQQEFRGRARDLAAAGLRQSDKQDVVYFIQAEDGGPIKIGFSEDIAKRLANMQTSRPDKLVVLATIPGNVGMEREIHERFRDYRLKGEWFSPSEEILAFLRSGVTQRDTSQGVTCHEKDTVTPSRAVPSRAVPSRTVPIEEHPSGVNASRPPAQGDLGLDRDPPKLEDASDIAPNAAIYAVFEHWRTTFSDHKNAGASGQRMKAIKIQLAWLRKTYGYSRGAAVDDAKAAITASLQDSFCLGQNPGRTPVTELSALMRESVFERLVRVAKGEQKRSAAPAAHDPRTGTGARMTRFVEGEDENA